MLCFRASSLYHCTRALKNQHQLGLAFFQKASLFRQLRKLLHGPTYDVIEGDILRKRKKPGTALEKRSEFERKRSVHEKEVAGGQVSLRDFMV